MPHRTIPRPQSLDQYDPWVAASSVDNFIGVPQDSGKWHIDTFAVNEQNAIEQAIRMQYGDSPGRGVPEGEYLRLWFNDPNEEGVDQKTTMMSNTPDEVNDHTDPFVHAKGDVLVHGLGLSCVVSGLLAKPEVTHIDVVDLSEDIINMVGPAYADEPRVTIHHGDAMTYEWPADKRWNYVWHDIWAKISDGNLDPAKAEYGITYFDLFDRFRDRCDRQNAWVFLRALQMEEAGKLADEKMREYQVAWHEGTPESRVELALRFTQESNRGDFAQVPIEAIKALYESSGTLDEIRKRAQDSRPQFFLFPDHLFYEQAEEYIGQDFADALIEGRMSHTPYEPQPFAYEEDRQRYEEWLREKETANA